MADYVAALSRYVPGGIKAGIGLLGWAAGKLIERIAGSFPDGTVTSTDGRINCGGGGACSASYDSGSRVILRARAGWLSSFDGSSGGGCSGTGDCVVTLGEDTMVTARFRLLGLF